MVKYFQQDEGEVPSHDMNIIQSVSYRDRSLSMGEQTGAGTPALNRPRRQGWSCPAYVPVFQLIYAAFRSNAKGLLLFSDEWRRREL